MKKTLVIFFLLLSAFFGALYDGKVTAAAAYCDCSDVDAPSCSGLMTVFTCGAYSSWAECLANCPY